MTAKERAPNPSGDLFYDENAVGRVSFNKQNRTHQCKERRAHHKNACLCVIASVFYYIIPSDAIYYRQPCILPY